MKKVMVLRWDDSESANPVKVDHCEATLHDFSVDSCVDEGELIIFPVAIIEWPDGHLSSIHIDFIRFLKESVS